MSAQKPVSETIVIENLQEPDVPPAGQIFRLAFGTFMGLPDPASFAAGTDFVRTRWRSDPQSYFAAKIDGRLVGTNFATNWGSVGFFGPLTIHPEFWDRGIGKRLMEPIMQSFSAWGTKHAGLFTFAQSPKHIHLYQNFGFWPRFLTAIMSLQVNEKPNTPGWQKYSDVPEAERHEVLVLCRHMTDEIFEGLDLQNEIRAVADQQLGDTVLLWDNSHLSGLAVCHCGEGSEAGPANCYVKFGAVKPGPAAADNFERLLSACEDLARERGLSRVTAGVNTARVEAYQQMLAKGFRTEFQGVTMHRPNEYGYSRPGIYALDDWR